MRFCLLCNELSRIILPLQSRCAQFRFVPLTPKEVRSTILTVAARERLAVADPAIDALVRVSKGDMRRVLNIMQAAKTSVVSMHHHHHQHTRDLLLAENEPRVRRDEQQAHEQQTHAQSQNDVGQPLTVIDVEHIYECTGLPSPDTVEALQKCLLRSRDFGEPFALIGEAQRTHALSLSDIVAELGVYALHLPLSNVVRGKLLIDLAEVQYRLTTSGASEVVQRAALVALYYDMRLAAQLKM